MSPSATLARKRAAGALGRIVPETVEALVEAMKDEDSTIRVGACFALAVIGRDAQEALPALLDQVRNGLPEMRVVAAESLSRVDPANELVAEELGKLLQDPDQKVQEAATRALEAIKQYGVNVDPGVSPKVDGAADEQ